MANPKGIITRKDIIEDEALKWGEVYSENIKEAITQNNILVESVKTLNKQVLAFKVANSQKDYIAAKQAEALATQEAINAIKKREAAEISAEKIKKAVIETSKIQIDLQIKKAKASSELSKLMADEEKISQQKLKTEKEKLIVEKELVSLEIKKQQLKNTSITVSKSELDFLQKEENIKKNKLKQLQDEENKLSKLQETSKQNILIWKEQNQLELALISTKKKNELATESTNRALIAERIELANTNKALKQEALERLGLVSAYTKLNSARTEAKNKLRDLIASESASIEEVKKAQKEFETLDKKVKLADKAVGDFTKNVGNYPFQNITSKLKDLVGAFGITVGIAAFGNVMKEAFDTIKNFQQGVADLSAITGATGKDLDYLRNQAIELGKDTKGGAIKVLDAYKLIASAKPELLENVESLNLVTEATLTLAKAAGIELPEAATALTDAMNQFGADASQASVFVDALANGAKYGAAEIPQTTEALLKFGAVARSSNINIKESVALVQLLAENGIKGAEAGTALRNVLLKISAPDALPKEAQQALKDLGISFELLKDKSIPIQEKFEALKPLLADNGKLLKAFGFENITTARNIIEHTDRLKDLTSKMGEVGTAEEQASKRMDTFKGAAERASSTYDSFILSIDSGNGIISKAMTHLTNGFTGIVNLLIRANTSFDDLNKKASGEGTKQGIKTFASQFNNLEGTGSTEDISKSIKSVANRNLELYKNQFNENEKKLAEFRKNAFRAARTYGVSEDDLKRDKERLLKSINEQASIIKQANTKIASVKKPLSVVPESTGSTGSNSETTTEKKAREKDAKEILDRAKKINDDLYELQKQRLESSIYLNNEIVKDDEESDDVRIAAALNSEKKQIKLIELTKQHYLDADKFVLENDKLSSNAKTRINEDASNKIIEIEKRTGEELDKINQFDESKYTKDLEDKISKQNTLMNSELEAENIKFNTLSELDKKREGKIAEHEQKIFDIKKKYAIEALKLQISNLETELIASDKLPKNEALSAEKRQKIAETLSKAKLDLSDIELSNNDKKNKKEEYSDREKAEKLLEISRDLTGALGDLANSIFDAKIANIDAEITASDEYYASEIEKAGDDKNKKDLLQKESEEKRKKLEAEKRKEQQKQAIFNKGLSAVQIGISTAMAIMQSYAQLGPISGSAGAILAGVLGAIQLAAVLATPIPKYKHGRKNGPEEYAYVGDGGVSEVIERTTGAVEITPASDTLVKLNAGDKVYSTVDE